MHLGMPNGEKTLETHKERTRFVKERLVTYRVSAFNSINIDDVKGAS